MSCRFQLFADARNAPDWGGHPLVFGLRTVCHMFPHHVPHQITHEIILTHASYDRISPSMRTYFESLTATCAQPVFKKTSTDGGYEIMSPRGSPLNVGDDFAPIHPMVRTHPVTGWKSIFAAVGIHVSKINDVYSYEDQMIRDYMMRLITRNHDCIARMKWTKQACAIWSNACTFHAATVSLLYP